MAMSQENTLYSYLKQRCIFLTKTEHRRQNGSCMGEVGVSGRGEDVRREYRRVNK
jgi:hypothetical protein